MIGKITSNSNIQLVQFRSFLTSNDTSEKIDKNFPSLCFLLSGIEKAQLFMTIRRQINFAQNIILLGYFSTEPQS